MNCNINHGKGIRHCGLEVAKQQAKIERIQKKVMITPAKEILDDVQEKYSSLHEVGKRD